VHVKVIRRSEQPHQLTNSRPGIPRNIYFFYEKNTGVAHFHVEAGPDGGFPIDQAQGSGDALYGEGQSPSDYMLWCRPKTRRWKASARRRLRCCRPEIPSTARFKLTRREDEVLSGLMKSLANKELQRT